MLLLEAIFLMLQGSECLVSSFLHLRILLSEWGGEHCLGSLPELPQCPFSLGTVVVPDGTRT